MTIKGKCCTAIAAALMAGGLTATAHADSFLNQITTNTPTEFSAAQIFGAPYDAYDIATIDDFTLTGSADVTSVAAEFAGYDGFTDANYANITAYDVNIYSSPTAAGNNLTGDVASFSINPAQATVVLGTDTTDGEAEVTLPVNIALASGTYYFGITPELSFADGNGQIAVGNVDDAKGNAYQANPGQGFGQGTSFLVTDPDTGSPVDAEYNVNGTYTAVSAAPEPTTWMLMILGIGGIGFAFRRAKRNHGFTFSRALAA